MTFLLNFKFRTGIKNSWNLMRHSRGIPGTVQIQFRKKMKTYFIPDNLSKECKVTSLIYLRDLSGLTIYICINVLYHNQQW